MNKFTYCCIAMMIAVFWACSVCAAPYKKLDSPPLTERWFGIYVDNERVGFYRQKFALAPEGYRIEADGNVRMKIMGFSKEASMREVYLVGKSLALRSFEVEQTINGISSRVSGKVGDAVIRMKSESNGTSQEKQLKIRGEVFPGPALNILPMLRDTAAGKSYKVMMFDPEELKVKEIKISVIGETKTPEGRSVLKLRNNLYPFVSNDILIDEQGNTLTETVRDGLVTTKAEEPALLGEFVSNLALAKKDLIYDFSMIRIDPPLKDMGKRQGLTVEITGWNDSIPLFQTGFQSVEKTGVGKILMRTGNAVTTSLETPASEQLEAFLKPADKIESDAQEIIAQAKELVNGLTDQKEMVRALSVWTADWLKDTIDDAGGAVASFKARTGNCQTHARLYTALARAAGIPTRFVSGLVYQEGKGFLYHSWAESRLGNQWVPVDPTYKQLPADVTHLKFFEGHRPEDMTPLIAIIGRIRITVLETK